MQGSLSSAIHRIRRGTTPFDGFGYLLAVLYALFILIPLYYVVISSFKDNAGIFREPLALPDVWDIQNYVKALESAGLARAMGVSLLVTVASEALILLVAFPAAYAIARIRTRLAIWFERFFSLGFLIPAFAVLVPIFLMAASTGLYTDPLSLILFYPAWRLPVSIVLLASYLRSIPQELEESAQIDGANRLQIILHVYFPLSKPGVVTVLVLNFIEIWNEFLFAFVLLSQRNRTVQVALSSLKFEFAIDYGLLAAGVMISVVPIYLVFLVFQEQITGSLFSGAIKG